MKTNENYLRRAMHGKLWLSGLLSFLFLFSSFLAHAQIYYIDAVNGNDASSGQSAATAWKSLSKVNGTTFPAGALILFKANCVWTGQLHPLGSGTAASPIVIDMYGTGAKPMFNGNGMTGQAVVRLFNQQYWEINNLEVINDAAAQGDRRGVEILASNFGTVNHVYLKDLDVHNIKGIPGQDLAAKKTAGIYIATVADNTVPTRFNNVMIDGCHISFVQNQGIVTNHEVATEYPGTGKWEQRKFTNFQIRNNIIHDISKNAMIIRMTEGGVVEYNVCYNTALGLTGNTIFSKSVLGTVFQYNEGYLNQSPDFDGSLYDADLMSPGTVWQYSYSHDNNHGLMWYCTDPRDTGVVVRYNISQNDKGYLVNINYPFTSSSIYNNVFYIGQNTSPIIMREVANTHNYSFQNNIIYNNSTTSKYIMGAPGNVRLIDYNIFYGNHPAGEPADARKITTDPLFVNPGTATTGLASVGGYKLKAGSPALGSGKLISNNGGKDYFGNPVSSTAAPHRGFFNGAVAPAPPAADFSMSTPSVCAGGSITFTSTSSGIVSSYSWDFGAGATPATATGSGPYTVSYNAAGSKTITLTASNSGGSSAKAKPATVNALPATSSITGSNTVSCNAAGVSYSVTNTSASVYNWTVPAGAVITAGQNTNAITVKFGTSSGNITVKETNGAGCAGNTVSVPVSVNCSSTITLNAKGDAYVRDGASAAITYGTSDATHLVTKNTGVTNDGYNRETYLSFDISGISGTISSVTLKLYGALGSGVDPVNVAAYPVANTSWAEGTISWNNKPAVSGAALASASVSDATGRYYTWDITNYVKNEKALGHTMVSFNLKNTTVQLNGPQTVWNSKEAGINSPQLVVSTGAARSGLADISEAESIKVYPNPAADLVSLSVPSVDYEEIRIVVTDENSAKVKEQTYQAKPGTNEIAINLSSLNPGLYYMTIYRQASNEVKKLVIQR